VKEDGDKGKSNIQKYWLAKISITLKTGYKTKPGSLKTPTA
jgi:hypothetical protein